MSTENKTMPLVSVLIRTKNRPESLLRAVHSVAEQSYSAFELIIVNDGGTPLPIKKLTESLTDQPFEISFTVQELKHSEGRSNAANQAMSLAKGEYFIFLDDDDWFTPEHLENLTESLSNNPDLIAVYSDTACVRSYENRDQILRVYREEYSRNALAAVNYLPIHSVLFRRDAFDKGCLFDPELTIYEDWHFWIQVACHGDFKRIGSLTAYYSSEFSGAGFNHSEKDYKSHTEFFFKKAVPYFSAEQIATLQYSYREFHNVASYNYQLEQKIEETQSIRFNLQKIGSEIINEISSTFDGLDKNSEKSLYRIEQEVSQLTEKQNKILTSIHKFEAYQEQFHSINHQNFKLEEQQKESSRLNKKHSKELLEIKNVLWQIHKRNEEYYRSIKKPPLLKIKKFSSRLKSKGVTLIKIIIKRDWRTLKEKLAYNFPVINNISATPSYESTVGENLSSDEINKVFHIVTPKHTLFVAKLLKRHLAKFGIEVGRIVDCAETRFDDVVHIVIAPQMCTQLPGRYIAFQMEQSVSSRWFNKEYFNILEHSMAILDYSARNIRYIQEMSPIHYKQIYYLPISNINNYFNPEKTPEKEYDVVFYGDVKNERRSRFLKAISKKYNTLIINDLFGEDLYHELLKGKVLVNIHYYENALLETTRLHEAISLGIPVITESSTDIDEQSVLPDLVKVTPIDDVEAMLEAIGNFLSYEETSPPEVYDDTEHFHFYLGRALLGCGLINEEQALTLISPLDHEAMRLGVGLSLPESWERRSGFVADLPDMSCFPGLRHRESWKGCAMSYKYLAHQALKFGMRHLEVMEDDVFLPTSSRERWEAAKKVFHDVEFTDHHCDLLSGLLADVSDETEILDIFEYNNTEYIIIDRMISAVCNYYGEYPLNLMSRWDPLNEDIDTNTMDRYLESYRLRVLVPLPFIAGHKPEKQSTLWSFSNETYEKLITKSAEKLKLKVERFKKKND